MSIFRENKGIDPSKLSSVPESEVLESRASFVFTTQTNAQNLENQTFNSLERPQSQGKLNLKWRAKPIVLKNQGIVQTANQQNRPLS